MFEDGCACATCIFCYLHRYLLKGSMLGEIGLRPNIGLQANCFSNDEKISFLFYVGCIFFDQMR
jgi:hypothetical protein